MSVYQKKLEDDIRCPLEYGFGIFGGKWDSRVICVLARKGPLRYCEIRKQLGNISDAVLNTTLKHLVKNRIVSRKSYDQVPPRVEYQLTEIGKSAVPILQSVCRWSGIFYKAPEDKAMSLCKNCDYNQKI